MQIERNANVRTTLTGPGFNRRWDTSNVDAGLS
jgi:hypothetical protein